MVLSWTSVCRWWNFPAWHQVSSILTPWDPIIFIAGNLLDYSKNLLKKTAIIPSTKVYFPEQEQLTWNSNGLVLRMQYSLTALYKIFVISYKPQFSDYCCLSKTFMALNCYPAIFIDCVWSKLNVVSWDAKLLHEQNILYSFITILLLIYNIPLERTIISTAYLWPCNYLLERTIR